MKPLKKQLKKQIKKKWYDIIYIEIDGVRVYTRDTPIDLTKKIINKK